VALRRPESDVARVVTPVTLRVPPTAVLPLAAMVVEADPPKDAVIPVRVPANREPVEVAALVVAFVPMRLAKFEVPVNVGPAAKTKAPPAPVSSVTNDPSSAEVSIEVDDTLLLKMVQSVEAR
jgi:hypothetical protein